MTNFSLPNGLSPFNLTPIELKKFQIFSRQNLAHRVEIVNEIHADIKKEQIISDYIFDNYELKFRSFSDAKEKHKDIYALEEDSFIKEKINEFGLKIKNKSKGNITNDILFSVLQGLTAAKLALKEIPKKIVFKDMGDTGGEYHNVFWNTIKLNPLKGVISPKANLVALSTVHETAHKNDSMLKIRYFPIELIMKIPSAILIIANKKKIISEVNKYATMDRAEFIAETARKMIYEKKSIDELDPKIKFLYKLFLGPKVQSK